jgi:hypothetical protein
MKRNKLQRNSNELEAITRNNTKWNKARVFIITALIVALIKLQQTNLKKLAKVINPHKNKDVNYRRLNRFFQKFRFDKLILGKLLASFLPEGKLVLSMDRTNWKFG